MSKESWIMLYDKKPQTMKVYFVLMGSKDKITSYAYCDGIGQWCEANTNKVLNNVYAYSEITYSIEG